MDRSSGRARRRLLPDQVTELAGRLITAACRAFADRDPQLHRLDAERTLAPDWFQAPTMIGYAAYADRFGGTLDGVRQNIPYL